jgi:NADP-dependent 3-hydroxy acid dehydrogenase YdfG
MDKEIAVLTGAGSVGVAITRRAGIGRTVLLADFNGTALNTVAEQLRDEYDVTTQVTGFRPHPRRSSG